MIQLGALISSNTITRILRKAIAASGTRTFLIDGYPRNMENVASFDEIIGSEVEFRGVIYFDCSEDVMQAKIKADNKKMPQASVSRLIQLYES